MSRIVSSERVLPSLYVTIIRSFRWKTFEHGDMSKFPAKSVFFDIMKKYRCKKPRTVAKHIIGSANFSEYERRTLGKIMSAPQFLKTLQFMRYNHPKNWDNDEINTIIRRLAEWIVSRTPEYDNAKWDF